MLVSSNYIKSELESMKKKFEDFNIVYAIDDRMGCHIIQVSPREAFLSISELAEWEYDFINRFNEQFEDEMLIISEPLGIHRLGDILYMNKAKGGLSNNSFANMKSAEIGGKPTCNSFVIMAFNMGSKDDMESLFPVEMSSDYSNLETNNQLALC